MIYPKTLSRYWHTIKYLRPVQIYGRVFKKLKRPRINVSPMPGLTKPQPNWVEPAKRQVALMSMNSWVFLNEPGNLEEIGWDGSEREKLWRYNQHYFHDLNSSSLPEQIDWQMALVNDWIKKNRPAAGVGWEPYPTSLRIVNWIKWSLCGACLESEALHSLAVQLRWLSSNLETHLLGNHLFSNAKALIAGGLFFYGREADKWLSDGLKILLEQIHEQILGDGGHFERSPMYHALILEDLLDLLNLFNCFDHRLNAEQKTQIQNWSNHVYKVNNWLKYMLHPDGEISFFNDAAFNVAPNISELDSYLQRLLPEPKITSRQSFTHLKDSGYIRLEYGPSVILLDVAPVGPDYLPAHAHADTLSFELSFGQQRVLVNSGTSCYGISQERQRQRGTAAHNTVIVNNQNSSDVWGGFRVARRAYPVGLKIKKFKKADTIEVICGHDGYSQIKDNPSHFRSWKMNQCQLEVSDVIIGHHQSAEARFHLHPEIKLVAENGSQNGALVLPNGSEIKWDVKIGAPRFEKSSWHPEFGYSIPSTCLVVKLINGRSSLLFSWKSLTAKRA